MQLKPEELDDAGYQLMDRLDHMELVPFVRKYLAERTLFSNMYMGANVVCFGLAAYTLMHYWKFGSFTLGDGITWFCYGMAIAFLLVPIHEFIHVLAYRYQGAQHTSYDVNLRKFYFLAVADKFVANRKEFQFVALAPFVVITIVGLFIYFWSDPFWKMAMSGMLLTHTAFCSGDFGLLSYFRFHKGKEIVTYDDRANKLSFFYGK
jgi:hypothetical protein